MERGYQYGFSERGSAMYDADGRKRKARTMVAVLQDHFGSDLANLSLLNVGGSAGIIDNYLADYFGSVTGVDIDAPAIAHARATYSKSNLHFEVGDALNLEFPPESFDVVICSQVYEHVADAKRMMAGIFAVLAPGGVCYFAANNRLMLIEPHYGLPLLSLLPRTIAHVYIRLTGKAGFYYEKHLTYWGLRDLTKSFTVHDYTQKIVRDPSRYFADYMFKPCATKAITARFVTKNLHWLSPGYIWLLEKSKIDDVT